MLLSMHVTSFLFLVLVGNSALTNGLLLELHALTLVDRSYALLVCSTGYYSRSAVFNSAYPISVYIACSASSSQASSPDQSFCACPVTSLKSRI